ncbi:PREDICTED: transmembrane protein 14C isoform X2 [Mandrillus leucophaeus]|uniref:transmembrane protein 14C isoform X2 n=1 Tax=Mandrillus leucophaeus TaxID=9568 RepID=UPI0005F49495|nr:PREDICTED: transmembrane protein 14C isoform X2 [Mandrillus leucophaeus]
MPDTGSVVPLHWFGFGYAALVASGGIIGYVKAGMRAVPGCGAALRQPSRLGCLPAVSGSKERLGFPSYIWYLGWHYGNEILQLWKIHACRFNCRCQFADGRQSWS